MTSKGATRVGVVRTKQLTVSNLYLDGLEEFQIQEWRESREILPRCHVVNGAGSWYESLRNPHQKKGISRIFGGPTSSQTHQF